jgi:hypothetical protein
MAALSLFRAVAVTVATALPSLGIEATLLTTEMLASPGVPPPVPVEQEAKLPQLPPPPQLPSAANATEAKTHLKIRMFIT